MGVFGLVGCCFWLVVWCWGGVFWLAYLGLVGCVFMFYLLDWLVFCCCFVWLCGLRVLLSVGLRNFRVALREALEQVYNVSLLSGVILYIMSAL